MLVQVRHASRSAQSKWALGGRRVSSPGKRRPGSARCCVSRCAPFLGAVLLGAARPARGPRAQWGGCFPITNPARRARRAGGRGSTALPSNHRHRPAAGHGIEASTTDTTALRCRFWRLVGKATNGLITDWSLDVCRSHHYECGTCFAHCGLYNLPNSLPDDLMLGSCMLKLQPICLFLGPSF